MCLCTLDSTAICRLSIFETKTLYWFANQIASYSFAGCNIFAKQNIHSTTNKDVRCSLQCQTMHIYRFGFHNKYSPVNDSSNYEMCQLSKSYFLNATLRNTITY